MNVDDGFEDVRWIRGLGGEGLPATCNALLPNLKTGLFFYRRRGIDSFCRLFSTHQQPNVFVLRSITNRRLAGARIYNRPCCERDQRVGRSPYNERAPFRFHHVFFVFVDDRYLSRTRNLAASNLTFG